MSVCLSCLSVCLSVKLVYCGQTVGRIKMKLGTQVGLGPGHIVLGGDPAPPPLKGHSPPPKYSAHVYCGQTAGWMKLVPGMEVGLSPDDFVLDVDPVLFPKRGRSPPLPNFGPFLLWPNGCMHQNATWYRARPRPIRLCVRWGTHCPFPKREADPQNFWPMFIVTKWLDG